MEWAASVAVHPGAFPEATRQRIVSALRRHEIDPALLYSGWSQAGRWIELHHAVAPGHTNSQFRQIYTDAFLHAARQTTANVLHVVSLCCGDGSKDVECLKQLRAAGKTVIYSPCDISLELVLTARNRALRELRGLQVTPLVCELLDCSTMPGILKSFDPSGAERVVLFLGTLHNFAPAEILRAVLFSVRSQDQLIVSANLAPETGYHDALEKIIRQYDNALTHRWLAGALRELDLSPADGSLRIGLESAPWAPHVRRIVACFILNTKTSLRYFGEEFDFPAGTEMRVFSSTRFTKSAAESSITAAGIQVENRWLTDSEEEGVFLCRRKPKN